MKSQLELYFNPNNPGIKIHVPIHCIKNVYSTLFSLTECMKSLIELHFHANRLGTIIPLREFCIKKFNSTLRLLHSWKARSDFSDYILI